MKKISIVTVNLNNKIGLEKTINSIVGQTFFNDVEYVVIDGGSTDGSVDVIKENKDKIAFWVSEKDNGIYDAMNKAIEYISGEYCIFINSGDFFHSPTILETMIPTLNKDIVYGDLLIHNGSQTFIKKYTSELSHEYFLKDTLPHQASFIKSKILKEHYYITDYKIISDWIFFYESIITRNCSYEHVPLIIADYHLGGISSDTKCLLAEKRKYLNNIENNIDIFICTHKDFDKVVNNNVYSIVDSRNIDKTYNNLTDKFYSELLQFFYVSENYKLKDYVGFCHYRRYFAFMDDIPNMDEVFKDCDIITARPREGNANMREEYKRFHNIEDLNIIEGIIEDKFPSYRNAMRTFLYGEIMFPYNMFIMKREDFLEYINFIKSVLDEYLKIVGTDIVKRIEDNKEKYLKDFYPNNTIEYQYRIGGYLAERLTTVFILAKFKKVTTYKVIITEEKYKENEQ